MSQRARACMAACVLLASTLFAGCLGSGSGASIPASALSSRGWHETRNEDQSAAAGFVQVHQVEYHPQGGIVASVLAGVILTTTPNIPILDESRFIPPAIEGIESAEDVDFVPLKGAAFKEAATVAGGVHAEAWNYNVVKSGLTAKAQVLHWDCATSGDFIVVAAYGTVGEAFDESKALARLAEC